MRLFKLLVTGISAGLLFLASSLALADNSSNTTTAATTAFSPEQTQQIQKIVHDYLLQNPQILLQVSNILQQQQQNQMLQQAQKAISANAAALFNTASSPVGGNPNGKVTIVEFFDYQCPHCKEMAPVVAAVVKNNPNVRVIYKEFPIFPQSDVIARAALAAQKQGKFAAFHAALMNASNPISQATVMQIAQSVGLNTTQLQADMNSPAINNEIKNNYKLASSLGLDFTPAFVIASNINSSNMKAFFVPGQVPADTLNKLIAQAASAANS